MDKIRFQIREGDPFIPLIQLLKAVNVVENGSEAQLVVSEGLVKRNGKVELRKRAKIVPGDKIEFDTIVIEVYQ